MDRLQYTLPPPVRDPVDLAGPQRDPGPRQRPPQVLHVPVLGHGARTRRHAAVPRAARVRHAGGQVDAAEGDVNLLQQLFVIQARVLRVLGEDVSAARPPVVS